MSRSREVVPWTLLGAGGGGAEAAVGGGVSLLELADVGVGVVVGGEAGGLLLLPRLPARGQLGAVALVRHAAAH